MATTLHSERSLVHPGPTRVDRWTRALRRRTTAGPLGAVLVLALVVILTLEPSATRVYALNMFGTLRAPGDPAFIAGHRGDRASAPENTIPAIASALESGMEFVEFDLQMTADKVPVLLHDATVDRTTDGTGAIADMTFAEARALDAGSYFSAQFAGTRIPSFAEFIDVFRASEKKALVELKGFWPADDVRVVVDAVYAAGVQDRIVFSSFDFTTLRNLETVGPAFPRVIIRRELPADPVGLATYYGAIAVLTSPTSVEADPTLVTRMHEAGLGVLLYTLNSEQRWSEALALGVDGIITDKPSSLDSWLSRTARGT